MSLMIRALGHASDEEIKALEKKYKLALPEDYKNFLKESNGGQFLPMSLKILLR